MTYWYQVIEATRDDGTLVHRFVDDDDKSKARFIRLATEHLARQPGVRSVRVYRASEQEVLRTMLDTATITAAITRLIATGARSKRCSPPSRICFLT